MNYFAGWTAQCRLELCNLGCWAMPDPIKVRCEVCGEAAEIARNAHIEPDGSRIEWPKAAVKSDGLYFTLSCPNCGEREQLVAKKDDTE
jgi:rRNA maturation protein Nop10